jgi:hypothetical protein
MIFEFLALERLQSGSKIRVTEKGRPFNSVNYAKTFRTEKLGEDLFIQFNGVIYRLNKSAQELRPCGEYWPYEGIKGALWE